MKKQNLGVWRIISASDSAEAWKAWILGRWWVGVMQWGSKDIYFYLGPFDAFPLLLVWHRNSYSPSTSPCRIWPSCAVTSSHATACCLPGPAHPRQSPLGICTCYWPEPEPGISFSFWSFDFQFEWHSMPSLNLPKTASAPYPATLPITRFYFLPPAHHYLKLFFSLPIFGLFLLQRTVYSMRTGPYLPPYS